MPILSAIFWLFIGAITGATFPFPWSPALFGGIGFALAFNQGNPGNLMRKVFINTAIVLSISIQFLGGLHYPQLTFIGLGAITGATIWFFAPLFYKRTLSTSK